MFEAQFVELVVLCGTAAGLVLLGLSSVVLTTRTLALRLAAQVGCVGVAAGVPAVAGRPDIGLVAAVLVALAALGSAVVASATTSKAIMRLGRPGVRAAVVSTAGGLLLIGALARYEVRDQEIMDRATAEMMSVTEKPPLKAVAHPEIVTDTGRSLTIYEPLTPRSPEETLAAEQRALRPLGFAEKLIRVAPATDATNCHGWVFTGGRYWLSPEDVEEILTDNHYQPVYDPRPGDLIVYRSNGTIAHSAVVRAITDSGSVLVEGKWGFMGTFLGAPEVSCYGRDFAFYRTPRGGHLLAGLAGAPERKDRAGSINLAAATVR
jgi:hypothetical protein